MNGDADVDAFVRLLDALGPWLSQVVIIGGWAHRLYRIHPNAQGLDYPPLMTVDTDVAVPATIQCAEQDIRGRLLAYGFAEELLGDDQPPATHYRLGDGEFYVEFLTPLRGPEYNRKNRRNATVGVGGIVSQRLRYVDILLYSPWSVDFEPHGFRGKVQIANPVSFLAQKILIHSKRDREDGPRIFCTCATPSKCLARDSRRCGTYGLKVFPGNSTSGPFGLFQPPVRRCFMRSQTIFEGPRRSLLDGFPQRPFASLAATDSITCFRAVCGKSRGNSRICHRYWRCSKRCTTRLP